MIEAVENGGAGGWITAAWTALSREMNEAVEIGGRAGTGGAESLRGGLEAYTLRGDVLMIASSREMNEAVEIGGCSARGLQLVARDERSRGDWRRC